jgi:hypothetical protein
MKAGSLCTVCCKDLVIFKTFFTYIYYALPLTLDPPHSGGRGRKMIFFRKWGGGEPLLNCIYLKRKLKCHVVAPRSFLRVEKSHIN